MLRKPFLPQGANRLHRFKFLLRSQAQIGNDPNRPLEGYSTQLLKIVGASRLARLWLSEIAAGQVLPSESERISRLIRWSGSNITIAQTRP